MKLSFYVALLCLLHASEAASRCHLDIDEVYGEGQLAATNASSGLDCCSKCFEYAGCVAFTYSAEEKMCYLKDNIRWVAARDGYISGTYASKTRWTRACLSLVDFPFCDPKLTIDERVDDLISRLEADEKPLLLTARASPKGGIPRLGIPEYNWGANCIHGVQSRCRERCPTSFPNPNAHGAMWNRSLWKDMAAVMGRELRALWLADVGENNANNLPHLGLDCWSPNININRDPRWGRNLETPGEDPFLNGEYGKHYALGLQHGEDPRYLQAVVTLKHFAAYSLEDGGGRPGMPTRHSYDAVVSKADLAGTYFPAFKKAIREGGAKGVMCSYNAVNGFPSCASRFLLQETLREAWNFTGYVTSDTGAVRDIYQQHWKNLTAAEGCAAAVKAGCDIDSAGHDVQPYVESLNDAVAKGLILQEDIDLLLKRSLRLRFELGLFDRHDREPYWQYKVADNVATGASVELSRLATRKSLVLLKNDMHNGSPALPLHAGSGLIAVLGPHAQSQKALVGNYLGQICSQGYNKFDCVEAPAAALQKHQGVLVEEGCDLFGNSTEGFARALAAATSKNVTAVVLFVGLAAGGRDDMAERESHDREVLGLPGVQLKLIKEVVKAVVTTKPVIVVLINGGALGIDWLREPGNSHAVVEAFYPGVYGADAIASLLYGEYSPGGKLPYTIMPSEYAQEVDFLNMSMSAGQGRTYRFYTGAPLWPFGFGLSYTRFELKLASSADSVSRSVAFTDTVQISVMVRNVGTMAGDEVVQVYFAPEDVSLRSPAPLPLKQLFDFERIHLAAGEMTELKFQVSALALALADADGNLVSAPGKYRLEITNGNGATVNGSILLHGAEQVLEPFPALADPLRVVV